LGELRKRWMEIKKTAKRGILPNCLQVINGQLFIKSPMEGLIMLWRLPNSSSTSFLILSHLKQSGMNLNKVAFVLLSRQAAKCGLLKKAHKLEHHKFARYHEN
jgi:hypothetical protein